MSRFLIAAAHKSSGKTVVSTGLARALGEYGRKVQTFKKGPDYIDPMWLSAASGRACYNLDFNTMGRDELRDFFASHAQGGDLSLIEANKGLFDGVDLKGSDSNAALAKLLKAPVVLVVDTGGMTRGIAPLLCGYTRFDPDVNIAGVILNKVGGPRHEGKLRAAVETYTDLPVLGAVWRNGELEIGERHLGLTTPAETGHVRRMIEIFGRVMADSVDLGHLAALADRAPVLEAGAHMREGQGGAPPLGADKIRIGIAQDTAFGFYYPDDLEAFAAEGAELVPFDTLNDVALPDIDGLFIGGGFPETQAEGLSHNKPMRAAIRQAIESGMPTYAECGGLMYLCESLSWNGRQWPMVGVVPGKAEMCERPQGRGYAQFENTDLHPWERPGGEVQAHEFHYARIANLKGDLRFARDIRRGAGIDGRHDGIVVHNLLAGFCHLRTSRANPWVRHFVDFVRRHRRK
ncbi:MAG: cobyrinate a,c-diamide synthase [Paracoccaceae bacterium]|nr:cobyrinate a,c-diamide synthase [Paracoccaceae bacterium]